MAYNQPEQHRGLPKVAHRFCDGTIHIPIYSQSIAAPIRFDFPPCALARSSVTIIPMIIDMQLENNNNVLSIHSPKEPLIVSLHQTWLLVGHYQRIAPFGWFSELDDPNWQIYVTEWVMVYMLLGELLLIRILLRLSKSETLLAAWPSRCFPWPNLLAKYSWYCSL